MDTITISALIAELEEIKKTHGDIQVFSANMEEVCFDGIAQATVVMSASNGDKFAGLIRGKEMIKI